MPVLIDGNNLLYAALEADPDRPPSRSTLCQILGQWARRTGDKVAIVFDGPAPGKQLARQIGALGVAVRYSGAGRSADEVLVGEIDADPGARRTTVVSSDREVARAARRRRAKPVRSDVFWARVRRDLARPQARTLEPPEKRRGVQTEETERWLRELGLDDGQPGAGMEEGD